MPDTGAERMRRQRGHAAGDHQNCSNIRCRFRQSLEWQNTKRLYARALFAELDRQHISAKKFLGARYLEIREIADTELPDYLEDVPGIVDILRARIDIADNELAI